MLANRGVCVWGRPIAEVFPPVPRSDYLASVRADLARQRDSWATNPAYAALNLARTCAYVTDGSVLSKDEGGRWTLREMPARFAPLLTAALDHYAGRGRHQITLADGEAFSQFWNAECLDGEP